MTTHERLELELQLYVMKQITEDAKQRARRAEARVAALEQQMRREGWTQADLDNVEPNVHQ